MSFPDKKYPDAAHYVVGYREEIISAWHALDSAAITKAVVMLDEAVRGRHTVFACGNGGSAAIANHLLCDFLKGIQTDTLLRPSVTSLSSSLELITAIANDIAYEEVFVYQLRTLAEPGDLLITISSSGNSENIVRALNWSRDNGVRSIALTGFDGGRSRTLADVNLHVAAHNYGIVEDIHQSLMHIMAQFLRHSAMPQDLLVTRRF